MNWLMVTYFVTGVVVLCEQLSAKVTPCGAHAPGCTCSKTKATCRGFMSYIPELPPTIKEVHLYNSNFSVIDDDLLSNLSSKIEKIDFTNTSTISIRDDAFRKLKQLSDLKIAINHRLESANISLKSITKNLHTLKFDSVNLMNLSSRLFQPLFGRSVTALILKRCRLKKIDLRVFGNMAIKTLRLSENVLTQVDTENNNIRKLKKLYLSKNQLQNIPRFCTNTIFTSLNDMTSLYLNNNSIQSIHNSSNCLYRLELINLNYNPIRYIQNNGFVDLKRLSSLSLEHMGRTLFIEEFGLNITHLSRLSFAYNNYHFDHLTKPALRNMFLSFNHVSTIDFTNNFLPTDPAKLRAIFFSMKNLQKLILQNVRLKALPNNIFQSLSQLKELVLKGNYISGWENGEKLFGNLKNLRSLYLGDNNIGTFNETSIPEYVLNNLTTFSLANNPFSCTCTQRWFSNWLRTTSVPLASPYPERYSCKNPPHLRHTNVQNYNPTFIGCLALYILIPSLVGIVLVCGLMIWGILYKFRWNIRYAIFKLSTGYVPLDNDENEYVGYVSHCDEDRHFVHDFVLPKIPNLCIRFRDFIPGIDYMDNVEKSIEASKKMLLVLSNEYFNSEWQVAELKFIHSVSVKRRKQICIVILLDKFDKKFLSVISRGFLQESPCLEWTEHKTGQKLFWGRLQHELAKPAKKYMNK